MISPPLAGNPAAEPVVEAVATPARMADAIPLTVHLPVDARGVALAIMATVALIFALNWAQPFLLTNAGARFRCGIPR